VCDGSASLGAVINFCRQPTDVLINKTRDGSMSEFHCIGLRYTCLEWDK